MDENLNQRIKRLRKEKNLTQLQLAEKLSITDKAVSKWEANDGNPDISLLPKLASILGVTIDYLLTGIETETISLDDMDVKKRREHIIKKDDLDNFIKYNYVDKNLFYDRHWHIEGTRVYVLTDDFWATILKEKAYKIFGHCFNEVIQLIKGIRSNSVSPICYVEILGNNFDEFLKLTIEKDRSDWLEALNFKFASITDSRNSPFKIGEKVSKSIDLIFKNRDKCPNCFKYLLEVEHKNDQGRWIWTYLDNLIIDGCIKYKLYDRVKLMFEQFKKESTETTLDRDYHDRYSVNGTYVLRNDPYASCPYIQGRCITATQPQLERLIADGNLDLARDLVKYNKEVDDILQSEFTIRTNFATMTDAEIEEKAIKLDDKLTPMQKYKKMIEKSDVLSINVLNDLWHESITDANLRYCKGMLESKKLTYFQLIFELNEKEDWKALFKLAVDSENINAINLFKSGKFEEGTRILINQSLSPQGSKNKLNLAVNSEKICLSKIPHRNGSLEEIKSDIEALIKTLKFDWVKESESELERAKLIEKMNGIANDITKEYIQDELRKGNVELVVIKLCAKLEAQLTIKFNREDDLFNLLNEYCDKNLRSEEWDYVEDEYVTRSDETQIRLLNKLRMNRNNIAHPQKDCEPLTLDELEKCIDYVFEI